MLNRLLLDGAEASPDRPLVVSPSGPTSYAAVVDRAARFATGLASRRIERFGAVVGDVGDLLALLAAASAVEAEACLYPASTSADEARTLADAFDHRHVLADAPVCAGALLLDDLAVDPPGPELRRNPARSPLLQLTTGTTGVPKGARNDWRRLIESQRSRGLTSDAVWLLTHPPNQFAGLSVLLVAVRTGATIVVPGAFRPAEALDALREHAVTHASGTPTFWRMVLGLLRDRSPADIALRQITLTGEAVPSTLLERLHDAFPDARLTQIYGATEFGSGVAVQDARSGLPASVLERGDDVDVQFRIEDGELWVRSRVGMLGYYDGDDVGDTWRRTGDLVEVRGDRIHFVGRAVEIMNIGGSKVHPLPIEDLIGRLPGVELVHVYGRSNPVTGQIVAADVVADVEDRARLEAEIRAACEALPAPARPRRIRFVDELATRDAKISRGSAPA